MVSIPVYLLGVPNSASGVVAQKSACMNWRRSIRIHLKTFVAKRGCISGLHSHFICIALVSAGLYAKGAGL